AVPKSIGTLSLTTLAISQQGLTGAIPDFIGQSETLQANLQNLDLSINQLTGNIPESLMQLKALKTLNLNTNLLSGDIPATLAQSNFQNTLTVLDLGANAFQNKIPDSISTMKNLLTLSLGKNSLNGQIPASLVKLVKLSDLVLNDNQLTGMWFANSSAISLGYCSNDPIKAIFIVDVISLVGPQANVIIVDKEEATLVKFLVLFQ
ncbi:14610_t:CDS:2, partial [Entrophospora sp. SA101]